MPLRGQRLDEELTLAAGPWRAVVAPLGASLRRLWLETSGSPARDVVWGYSGSPTKRGGQGDVLMPWPGRIGGGRYVFAGVERELERNDKAGPNAIHGLVRNRMWTVTQSSDAHAAFEIELQPHDHAGYPFHVRLQVEYALASDGLACRSHAANLGTSLAPFGAGFHPYLMPASPTVDGEALTLEASLRVERGDDLLPTGRLLPVLGTPQDFRVTRAVGSARLDDTFTGLRRGADGRATVDYGSARLWMDEAFPYVHVFSGDTLGVDARKALAVEPMTCAPDAFRHTALGLRLLEPGAAWTGSWGIAASP